MANILIIGCGYVGTALGRLLLAADHNVWGLRRNPNELPAGFQQIACDLTDLASLKLGFQPDYIFFMPAAGKYELAAYEAVYASGAQHLITCLHANNARPKRLFYISSTSVYGQNDGAWVNEASPTQTSDPYAAQLLFGEKVMLASQFATTVVRFAGIYGPGRKHFLNQVISGKILRSLEPIYTNRIHREDCAGILQFLMNMTEPEALYLGVDSEPVLKNSLIEWIAAQYQLQLPEMATKTTPQERHMRGNKRCSNQKILAAGYTFHYPSFREGYTQTT
jgi:nucleoside-diphosphate-sugar epimerase